MAIWCWLSGLAFLYDRRVGKTIGLLVVLIACVRGAFGQGSLTPPGPPAPAMKSLGQIEAEVQQVSTGVAGLAATAEKRVLISAPVVINAPGSYILTSSVAVPDGFDGIQI